MPAQPHVPPGNRSPYDPQRKPKPSAGTKQRPKPMANRAGPETAPPRRKPMAGWNIVMLGGFVGFALGIINRSIARRA